MFRQLGYSVFMGSVLFVGVLWAGVIGMSNGADEPTRTELWQQVKKAQNDKLPKTAVGLLGNIYEQAVAEADYPDAVRALCMECRVEGAINQPQQPYMIRKLEKRMTDLPPRMQPVMRAILADWFMSYYQQNRWQFMQRSQTGQSPSEDFETWDLPRLLIEIDRLLSDALADEDALKQIPIAQYESLLEKGSISDLHRPTLYDFLAHRAIQFYQLDEQITRQQDAFELKADSPIFADRDEFLAWQPATEDNDSFVLKAVRLFQDLLRFHADDENPTALLDADLHRLALGSRQAVGDEVDVRYRAALQRWSDRNVKHELSSKALSQLAGSWKSKNKLVEAHKIATLGMKRFPESLGGRQCYNQIQNIEAPTVSVLTEQVWNAAQPELQVTYKNTEKLHFRVLPFDYRNWQWGTRGNPENLGSVERKALVKQRPAAEWTVDLTATPDYQQRQQQVKAKLDLPSGCYLLLASHREDFSVENNKNHLSVSHVWISDLAVVSRQSGKMSLDGQVVDAITGKPVAGAKVSVHSWKHDGKNSHEVAVGTNVTDADGLYRVATRERQQHQVYIEHEDQKLGFQDYVNQYGSRYSTSSRTFFFTDRALYRPGQTIQFKGICVKSATALNSYSPLANEQVIVALRDMNDQEVDRKTFSSNEFGSISGSFVATRGRATGRMSLRVEGGPNGQANVRVEEYKRPKFFVDAEKPTQQLRLDQPVTVKVKAAGYTGAASDGSKVVWRVERGIQYPQWWYWRCWWMPPNMETQQIANGEGVTSTDGTFDIEFLAKPDESIERESQPIFVFKVTADVTDTAGETRSATQTVRVGYTSMSAHLSVDNWLTTEESIDLKITTKNLNEKPLPAKGKLTIYQLKAPDKVQRVSLGGNFSRDDKTSGMSDIKAWPLSDSVQSIDVETDSKGQATSELDLAAGAYKAVFETTDDAGQVVSAEVPFLVRDLDANHFAVKIPNDFAARDWTVEPGEELLALWGTGYDTGRAYVEIEHRGRIVQAYWTDPEQTQAPIRFQVEEKHRGGFQVRVTYVRDNRAYLSSRHVQVPWSNKDLTIKWEHFTSKLQPGGRETWTAVVSGPDAEQRTVEMVAAMYDASLDAFAPHAWSNQIKQIFYRDYSRVSLQHRNQPQYLQSFVSLRTPRKGAGNDYRRFGRDVVFNPRMWSQWYSGGGGGGWGGGAWRYRGLASKQQYFSRSSSVNGLASAPQSMSLAVSGSDRSDSLGLEMQDEECMPVAGEGRDESGGPNINLEQIAARKNLQETAFFYPNLTTDENGVVRIEFEIPEALTKWKFLGFAHDAELRTALLTDEMATSKDLMVQPNPPRFLREGDQLEFSVKITNQSDKPATGSVRLTFSDARTDENMDAAFANQQVDQPFEVPAGESKSVFWKLNVPDYVGVLAYKVVGATEKLSDGEEGLLPVLSKRILVTESLPLPIRGNQTKTFNFDRLDMIDSSDTLKSQSLTVQMTSNPSWYAVLALPYLMEYPHQCNEQVFNRLYANALGRHIVTSNPRIKRVFDQWKGTDALDSPLEKNEDIRNVLIEETPWLKDAKDESQARREVAVLFDQNRLDNELRRAAQQLGQAQYSDGSWSWFPGGPANDFITLYITTGFGRLRHLDVEVDAAPAIKALPRLDGWIHSTWQRLKNEDKLDRNNLSSQICLYLYGRSFFLKDQSIGDQHREAIDYFLGQAKQYWTGMGRMSQAQLAIALKRFADEATPAAIMKSLTERSQTDEEMGRFWRESEESWWWYRAPIETQAMLIEAYDEVLNDAEKVEDCKVWLLKQKQTQNWKTTKATADAVYSLLLRGADSLSSSKLVEVTLGSTKVEPGEIEAGTGFYEQKFAGGDVKSAMKTIQVAKSDDGVAWGSVHWQYLEDVAKIKPYEGTPLQLKKSLYIKKNTKEGPVINPVAGAVEVGDELVTRVELRVDRDMEYVHLKDQRGCGTEPVNVLSQYKHQDGLWYYESTRDTASHFFIDYLPRGTYVFEYSVRVQHRGEYQSGIASLECMYAPEYKSHSNSVAIQVE